VTDEIPNLRQHAPRDVAKWIGVTIGLVTAVITIGGIFIALGRKDAAIDQLGEIKKAQSDDHDTVVRTKMQVDLGTGTIQRVEQKLDDGFREQRSFNERVTDTLVRIQYHRR
jgi:hypothetical protein